MYLEFTKNIKNPNTVEVFCNLSELNLSQCLVTSQIKCGSMLQDQVCLHLRSATLLLHFSCLLKSDAAMCSRVTYISCMRISLFS